MNSLRKYFDYSIKNSSTSPVQYSALNLAALYHRLEFPSKALSAIRIGLLYARDLNDQECLSYLLCWLHQLTYTHGQSPELDNAGYQPSENQMLESLATRTINLKQYDLAVICELRKAKCEIESGSTLASVEAIIKGAVDLCLKHNLKLWHSI